MNAFRSVYVYFCAICAVFFFVCALVPWMSEEFFSQLKFVVLCIRELSSLCAPGV